MHILTPISSNLKDKQLHGIRDSNGIVGINFCTGFLQKDGKLTPNTPVEEIVRHISYAIDRIGIEHAAIGSDFDSTLIPRGIGDGLGLPNLNEAFFDNGFDKASVRKIAFENWLRIFSDTWQNEYPEN